MLRAGKARSQPASFSMAEPRRGPGYVQATGTDVPVLLDVSFRFNQAEAMQFQLWFEFILRRGLDEFTLPIRTEFGLVEHVCRFLPDGLLDTSEDGETFGYRAQLMARALVIPQEYRDAADLIANLPNWTWWSNLLDQTVNRAMPRA